MYEICFCENISLQIKIISMKWLEEAAGNEFSSGERRREEITFFSAPGGGMR